ncbi:MAG: polyprenyl synthetase family protein [Anaerolineae bacterium]|nr:polyprenyl synthetase family protein [Anaerolineae bacterium]
MTTHDMNRTVATDDMLPLLQTGLQAVENAMYNVVKSDVEVLRDASTHILSAGGKRVRPHLLMLAYLACGGTDVTYAAPPAAAVELMHTASVVHDDINDHGVVRRGRPSVNAKWGRTFALLTGDFLFTAVYQLMAPYGDLNKLLAEAATALVEGETLQAHAVKNNEFTRENYARIISLKTAALFQSAGEIGARLADTTEDIAEALGNYGFNIGLAFQIVDDILDIVGDEETLGKTSGIDVEQGRGITAIENTEGADIMDAIKRKLLSGNRLEEARQQAQAFAEIAIEQLDVLPDSYAKTELADLANKVINRNK